MKVQGSNNPYDGVSSRYDLSSVNAARLRITTAEVTIFVTRGISHLIIDVTFLLATARILGQYGRSRNPCQTGLP